MVSSTLILLRPLTPPSADFLTYMKSFGLGDVAVQWIEIYLSGRIARVHIAGELSGAIPMRSDVPQGFMIGPFTLLHFVNDLSDALETLTLHFAGDIKMVFCRSRNISLHISLSTTMDWSKKLDLLIKPA